MNKHVHTGVYGQARALRCSGSQSRVTCPHPQTQGSSKTWAQYFTLLQTILLLFFRMWNLLLLQQQFYVPLHCLQRQAVCGNALLLQQLYDPHEETLDLLLFILSSSLPSLFPSDRTSPRLEGIAHTQQCLPQWGGAWSCDSHHFTSHRKWKNERSWDSGLG